MTVLAAVANMVARSESGGSPVNSVAASGYGMFVVNNEPRNVPKAILDDRNTKVLFTGYLSYLKGYQLRGGQKFE